MLKPNKMHAANLVNKSDRTYIEMDQKLFPMHM